MRGASRKVLGENRMAPKRITTTVWLWTFVLVPWTLPARGQLAVSTGGPVTVVAADSQQKGTLLAGTSAAVLYRSRDWADSWERLAFPAELRSTLHAVATDPTQPNVYLVAVTSDNSQYAGVYRSVDGGDSWGQLPGLRRKQVWSLAYWAADANVIAAGTQDGVYLTRDGGENWIQISSLDSGGPRPVVALAFDPAHPTTLYAGTPHLSWKTTDGGATWRALRRGMEEDSDIFSIAVDRTRPRRLFAGACSGIYRSLDGGNSWTSLERAVGAQFRTYVIAGQPRGTNIFVAGTNAGILKSLDGGATWRKISTLATRSIAFHVSDPRRVIVATDQGILRSDDGGDHFNVVATFRGNVLAATAILKPGDANRHLRQ